MANLVHPAAIASVASFIKNKNDLFNWYRWYIEIAVFIYINLCVTICPNMLYVFDFLAVNYMYMYNRAQHTKCHHLFNFFIWVSEPATGSCVCRKTISQKFFLYNKPDTIIWERERETLTSIKIKDMQLYWSKKLIKLLDVKCIVHVPCTANALSHIQTLCSIFDIYTSCFLPILLFL